MEYGVVLVLVMAGIVAYLFWDTYVTQDLVPIKTQIDGNTYMVRDLPDKQEAAELLAEIKTNLIKLQTHLTKLYPDDKRVKQLNRNFTENSIFRETTEKAHTTSYSINKGEKIIFCLRSRDVEEVLADINTLMFVAIHEYSHIGTESIGHTPEFWENFKWILEESINIGIYKQVDYKSNPEEYCGMKITGSPLD